MILIWSISVLYLKLTIPCFIGHVVLKYHDAACIDVILRWTDHLKVV